VDIVDIKQSVRLKNGKSHLSEALVNALKETLENHEQAILFRNRRGYSPMLMCNTCGHIPQCKNCDVSLTYHKFSNLLKCHYCGYKTEMISECPACGNRQMRPIGYGTEKIEDEIALVYDRAKVKRMDYDSVKGKTGHQKLIQEFENGKIDILVGTQMVTKGLDFENVALVGILNADQLLKYPDFRSNERAFQLMVQVSGRAGRKKKRGKVLIQAADLGHPILKLVVNSDYEQFYEMEITERKAFQYPPFVRIINLHLKHKDRQKVFEAAWILYRHLNKKLGNRVYEPIQPVIGKIRNLYLFGLMIKVEKSPRAYQFVRNAIHDALGFLMDDKQHRQVTVYADVDPV
jgi:primosomal protein N' (replication factor Y) (superfamily II helicase)